MGSKASGIVAHARGWDVGALVDVSVGDDGRDVVRIYQTGGSNGNASQVLVLTFREGDVLRAVHH